MDYFIKLAWIFIVTATLSACWERTGLAPVVETSLWRANPIHNQHVVARGETLYSIAFRYDKDYRALAQLNRLPPPYIVRVGQVLRLSGYSAAIQNTPIIEKKSLSHSYTPMKPAPSYSGYKPRVIPPKFYSGRRWSWPVQGRIVASFAPQQGKKGIDIAGRKGEKIKAAANGVVAYAGSGLAGYGNLIILKHDNQYLTAYGNNLHNFVREGQIIKAGQTIAEMGIIDRHFWGVHFEIRHSGQPVNPLNYLK